MRRFLTIFLVVIGLTACASTRDSQPQSDKDGLRHLPSNVGDAAGETYSQTKSGLGDAALSPLEDLNLRREAIPKRLKGVESPYDLPRDMDCVDIGRRVGELNGILGPDWDTPNPDERLRTEKLADSAAAATLGMVASEARGMIPFRGLVRKLTGAENHQKKYNRAYKIGAQQRAYLKGLGEAKGCPFPARPDFSVSAEPEKILYSGDTPHTRTVRVNPPTEPLILSPPSAPIVESEGLQTLPSQYDRESQP